MERLVKEVDKKIIDYEEVDNEECKNMGMTIEDIQERIKNVFLDSQNSTQGLFEIFIFGYVLAKEEQMKTGQN